MEYSSILEAVEDFKNGKCVVVIDDEHRENEGDIVCAAEKITCQQVNFMVKECKGLICAPISQEIASILQLSDMVTQNTELHRTKFTVSVDVQNGTTSGISTSDRAKTLRALANKDSKAQDFLRPGHIFPIIANPEGLKGRRGHTEAAVTLTHLAGLRSVAVICEILKEDGEMARENDLKSFAKTHNLMLISVHQLAEHVKCM